MTEDQNPTVEPEDTEGHGVRHPADAEGDKTDDTEGHVFSKFYSDVRLKRAVEPVPGALAALHRIRTARD